MTDKELTNLCIESIDAISNIIEKCIELNKTNEQWFLDYLDTINAISVKY